MQQWLAGWTETLGRCSEDTASVHGVHALPTELLWCHRYELFLMFCPYG